MWIGGFTFINFYQLYFLFTSLNVESMGIFTFIWLFLTEINYSLQLYTVQKWIFTVISNKETCYFYLFYQPMANVLMQFKIILNIILNRCIWTTDGHQVRTIKVDLEVMARIPHSPELQKWGFTTAYSLVTYQGHSFLINDLWQASSMYFLPFWRNIKYANFILSWRIKLPDKITLNCIRCW